MSQPITWAYPESNEQASFIEVAFKLCRHA